MESKCVSLADVKAREYDGRWTKERLEDGSTWEGYEFLTIPRYNYFIDAVDLDTPMKLLARVHHLSAKKWMTTWEIHHMVMEVCKHFGFKLYGQVQ